MTFVCFFQVYVAAKYTRFMSGLWRIAWNLFQLQQKCFYGV